jgi:hypothetical protein
MWNLLEHFDPAQWKNSLVTVKVLQEAFPALLDPLMQPFSKIGRSVMETAFAKKMTSFPHLGDLRGVVSCGDAGVSQPLPPSLA